MRKESATHRVVVVATPGTPDFELAIPCEVFGIDRSDVSAQWYTFELVTSQPAVTTAHRLAVPEGRGLAAVAEADTVIVPACADAHRGVPEDLLAALRAAHSRGARIASLCSGAFILAQAGLLDHRRATTHWMHAEDLARGYPLVDVDPRVLYVHDDVWTSAGSAAALDMCIELVRDDLGAAVANEVARRIVIPPHRSGGQAQFLRATPPTTTLHLAATLDWARGNIATTTVNDLAAHAGVSHRTLHRTLTRALGRSPQEWLTRERVLAAQQLLETTDLTVDTIATRTGHGSGANLRAQFTRHVGLPPSHYRSTFRTHPASCPRDSAGCAAHVAEPVPAPPRRP